MITPRGGGGGGGDGEQAERRRGNERKTSNGIKTINCEWFVGLNYQLNRGDGP